MLTLEELNSDFEEFLEKFPERQRDLVEDAGERLYQRVLHNIDTLTKEKTGRLRDACYKHIGSGGGYAAVRNDYKKAKHAHLVEFGHDIYKGAKTKEGRHGLPVKIKRSGEKNEDKFVKGKFMYRNAINELEDELIRNAEQMAEKLVGDVF